MSAVDATMRKLHIKPRFLPYIEKHRIYDLLYDVAVAICTRKPKDHILFVRNLLNDIKEMRDKPRIFLIAPPHISAHKICKFIKEETGIEIISFNDIQLNENDNIASKDLAIMLNKYIDNHGIMKNGWVMYEFPRNFAEAKIFQKYGLYPNHTFEICSSPNRYSMKDAWFENIKEWPIDQFKKAMTEFKRKAFGLRRALACSYKELPVNSRTNKQLATACVEHTRIPIYKGASMLPRVVLIGTRGSKRRTIGKLLSEKYKIVHVDLEELILRGKEMENETGKQLRNLENNHHTVYSKIVIGMLQQRLLLRDCLHKGWVLTGFPRDVADFKIFDSFDTPPNKIIFLSIENSKAYQRLKNRKVNIYDGELKNIDEIITSGENIKEYFTHPRDYKVNVFPEQNDFAENIEEMLKYCGDNCNIVDAEGTDNEVYERVARILLQPVHIAPRKFENVTEIAKKKSYEFVLKEHSHTTIYPNIVNNKENAPHYVNLDRIGSILTN